MRGSFLLLEFSDMLLSSIITHVYASIAKTNSVVMAETMTIRDRAMMMGTIKDARKKFQLLQKTAAKVEQQKPARSRANTRSPSPAPLHPITRPTSPFFIDSIPGTSNSEYTASDLA